jgi:DNA-binding CsgD family transcriptional regulator
MKFKIEGRTVALLLAQSMTETEIAKQLNVDQLFVLIKMEEQRSR